MPHFFVDTFQLCCIVPGSIIANSERKGSRVNTMHAKPNNAFGSDNSRWESLGCFVGKDPAPPL